jgi:basic amino acid/polyamine antiporter, APA family
MANTAVGGSEAGGTPKLFVRRSSGLVREMSAGDALIGNILIFNLVIASITLLLIPWTFPGASLPLSIVLTFIPAAFLATVYVLFGVAMPRSGGDYVFISRTLHPALGFAANFSFVIWNAIYIGVYGNWISTIGLSGMFAAFGLTGAAHSWSSAATSVSGHGLAFAIGTVANVGMALVVIRGLRFALRTMKYLFYIGTFGLIVAIVVVGVTSHGHFLHQLNTHGTSAASLKSAATKSGFAFPSSWHQFSPTVLAVGLLSLSMLFVVYSVYTAGEVKNVRRSIPLSIYGCLAVGGILFLIMGLVAEKTWGNQFMASINQVFYSAPKQYPFSSSPSYSFLAALGQPNVVLIILISFGFILIPIASMIFNFIVNSRCVFAWSADRLIPEKAAAVNDRWHSPVYAIILVAIITEAALAWYTFSANATTFLGGSTMGYMATFLTTAAAAVFFPYLKKTRFLYEASPLKPRVLGIPVISIAGVVTFVLFGILIYGFLENSVFGANSTKDLFFFGGLWVVGLIGYGIARWVRHSQGVPLEAAFKELPPE